MKALSALLGFGTTIVLARTLASEHYGLYAYILSIITVVALPAKAQLTTLGVALLLVPLMGFAGNLRMIASTDITFELLS